MIRIPCALAGVILLACAPRAEPPDSMAAPAEAGAEVSDVTTGTVAVVGSAPVNDHVILRMPDGRNVRLAGPLAEEVRRLSGAQVAVHGPITDTPDPMAAGQIQVTDYEVVSIDGAPVVAGEVIAVEGGRVRLRTRNGEEVLVSGAPDSFRVGQKVWVQGPTSISVQAYGVIRP